MAKTFTKEETIKKKKESIKTLNNLLESYINSTDEKYLKKASIISKWISQYSNYIYFEEHFNPKQNISYSRGDIIFVNFGFNVGAELGGEHYAVVLDKESNHKSSTLTVVPLTSHKPDKNVHPNDLFLGNELYEKLKLKLKTRLQPLNEQNKQCKLMLGIIREKMRELGDLAENDIELLTMVSQLEEDSARLEEEIANIMKIKDEILSLKLGSVAKIKQITTISKIRIYNPKKSTDPLYGIHYTEETMDKINNKIKELYVF